MTTANPSDFIPKITKLCRGSGVAFVLVPELSKVPWNGATKWLSPNKAMIILSLRGKREDKFCFTLFTKRVASFTIIKKKFTSMMEKLKMSVNARLITSLLIS